MSKVLIYSSTMTAFANKIRRKTATNAGLTAANMVARLSMVHGYLSNAYALSNNPVSYPESTYALLTAQTTTAEKVTNYKHAEPSSIVSLTDYTFAATAAKTTDYKHREPISTASLADYTFTSVAALAE